MKERIQQEIINFVSSNQPCEPFSLIQSLNEESNKFSDEYINHEINNLFNHGVIAYNYNGDLIMNEDHDYE